MPQRKMATPRPICTHVLINRDPDLTASRAIVSSTSWVLEAFPGLIAWRILQYNQYARNLFPAE
jgi:hypothetical protein